MQLKTKNFKIIKCNIFINFHFIKIIINMKKKYCQMNSPAMYIANITSKNNNKTRTIFYSKHNQMPK